MDLSPLSFRCLTKIFLGITKNYSGGREIGLTGCWLKWDILLVCVELLVAGAAWDFGVLLEWF